MRATIVYDRRGLPWPSCKHCGKPMDAWNPWIKDEDHAHPRCAGIAAANEIIEELVS